MEIRGRLWELGSGDVFLNYPGMEYRCRHHQQVPNDECTSIACVLPTGSSGEIVAFEGAVRAQPVLPRCNRLAYLFLRAKRASNDQLAAEEAAHEVIISIIHRAGSLRRAYREHQLTWYAERVDAVRRLIDQHPAADYTLVALARSVGMSTFHFARIFRELVGIPPHLFLCRTRLRHAACRLRDGASVTDACFSSGFQNLSHFSRQFHRQFGVKPSAYPRKTAG